MLNHHTLNQSTFLHVITEYIVPLKKQPFVSVPLSSPFLYRSHIVLLQGDEHCSLGGNKPTSPACVMVV